MSSTDPISRVIEQLTKIPTIGEKSAERIALHLVKTPADEVKNLAQAIADIKNTKYCTVCFNTTLNDGPCKICSDDRRDHSRICVVEQPSDLRAIEQTGVYQGLYHILNGHISPLDGISANDLTMNELLVRIKENKINEVILATNPTLEGDATALYLQKKLISYLPGDQAGRIKLSRLAKGIASGSTIEYASKVILTDAIKDRKIITRNGSSSGNQFSKK